MLNLFEVSVGEAVLKKWLKERWCVSGQVW